MSGYLRDERYELVESIIELCCLFYRNLFVYGIGKSYHAGQISLMNNNMKNISKLKEGIIIKTENNKLYVNGKNGFGALGISKKNMHLPYQLIDTLNEDIKLISNGISASHSFILTSNNILYGSGLNVYGQLGNGTNKTHVLGVINLNWLNQKTNETIIKIECGHKHSIFLTNSGLVFGCGHSNFGELGLQTPDNILTPKLINAVENDINNNKIIDISCGAQHTLILDEYYNLIGCGSNTYGQTNNNTDLKTVYTPTYHKYFKDKSIKIKQISSGQNHSLSIDMDRKCYMFGNNIYHQCGHSTLNKCFVPFLINENNNAVFVISGNCGANHTVLLSQKNNVMTFGKVWSHTGSSQNIRPHTGSFSEYSLEPEFGMLAKGKFSKIGVDENQMIEGVLALYEDTLIFMNHDIGGLNENISLITVHKTSYGFGGTNTIGFGDIYKYSELKCMANPMDITTYVERRKEIEWIVRDKGNEDLAAWTSFYHYFGLLYCYYYDYYVPKIKSKLLNEIIGNNLLFHVDISDILCIVCEYEGICDLFNDFIAGNYFMPYPFHLDLMIKRMFENRNNFSVEWREFLDKYSKHRKK
eukprot:234128_1